LIDTLISQKIFSLASFNTICWYFGSGLLFWTTLYISQSIQYI